MKIRACLLLLLFALLFASEIHGQPRRPETFTDPQKAGEFAVQGEFEGLIAGQKYGLQIVAQGNKKLDAYILPGGLPGTGWDGKSPREKISGALGTEAAKTTVAVFTGNTWTGEASPGNPAIFKGKSPKGVEFTLTQVFRKSPTEGLKPPPGALVLFDGTNVNEWTGGKLIETNLLTQGATTKKTFKDFKLHAEYRLPFQPAARGQSRGNSGIYLQMRYEIQILDSFGLQPKKNDFASIYEQTPPSINMCYPPLSWQTYEIDFKAARYDTNGKKSANAVVTVVHNGITVQDQAAIIGPTGHGQDEANTPGVVNLQNHSNPVYFRNIWLVETGK